MIQLRWSYGVRLLAQADEEPEHQEPTPQQQQEEQEQEHDEITLLLPRDDSQATLPTPAIVSSPDPESSNIYVPNIVVQDIDRNRYRRRQTTYFRSFPNSPSQSRINLALESPGLTPSSQTPHSSPETSEGDDDDEAAEQESFELPSYRHRRTFSIPTNTPFQSFLRRTCRRLVRLWIGFNEFMTVPLWAALLSLIVACVQPLQHTLDVHMEPVKGALNQASNCSIPLTLVVLGAYFHKSPETPEGTAAAAQKLHASNSTSSSRSLFEQVKDALNLRANWRRYERSLIGGAKQPLAAGAVARIGETKTVIIAIASRMVIVPLLLLPLMAASTWYDWHEVFEE